MNPLITRTLALTRTHTQRALLSLAVVLPLALSAALLAPKAQAAPVFAPYTGSGNLVLFDAATGVGGWVGAIEQFPDPGVTDPLSEPLSLVSVVLFTYDAAAMTLSGSFEFTSSADLASTLFGSVSGLAFDADIFNSGGQFALDYDILGGTGDFTGALGFGLAFLSFDPNGGFDNYSEDGLLLFDLPAAAVPLPGTLPLLASGLLGMWVLRRRR